MLILEWFFIAKSRGCSTISFVISVSSGNHVVIIAMGPEIQDRDKSNKKTAEAVLASKGRPERAVKEILCFDSLYHSRWFVNILA